MNDELLATRERFAPNATCKTEKFYFERGVVITCISKKTRAKDSFPEVAFRGRPLDTLATSRVRTSHSASSPAVAGPRQFPRNAVEKAGDAPRE